MGDDYYPDDYNTDGYTPETSDANVGDGDTYAGTAFYEAMPPEVRTLAAAMGYGDTGNILNTYGLGPIGSAATGSTLSPTKGLFDNFDGYEPGKAPKALAKAEDSKASDKWMGFSKDLIGASILGGLGNIATGKRKDRELELKQQEVKNQSDLLAARIAETDRSLESGDFRMAKGSGMFARPGKVTVTPVARRVTPTATA